MHKALRNTIKTRPRFELDTYSEASKRSKPQLCHTVPYSDSVLMRKRVGRLLGVGNPQHDRHPVLHQQRAAQSSLRSWQFLS